MYSRTDHQGNLLTWCKKKNYFIIIFVLYVSIIFLGINIIVDTLQFYLARNVTRKFYFIYQLLTNNIVLYANVAWKHIHLELESANINVYEATSMYRDRFSQRWWPTASLLAMICQVIKWKSYFSLKNPHTISMVSHAKHFVYKLPSNACRNIY